MRHVRLEAFDDDYGNCGLIIVGSPKNETLMADTEGGLIAHDLLEHQNGVRKIGCPMDEVEATGGLWQVRGRHGDFVQDDRNIGSAWTPEQNVALNLTTIARESTWQDWMWVAGKYRTQRHHQDDVFIDMLDWVRPHILAEVQDGRECAGEELYEPFPLEAFLDNALHLMRTGYRKAERRFGCGYGGVDTFRAIKQAVAPYCKHAEHEDQQFRLSYGNGEARCEEVFE